MGIEVLGTGREALPLPLRVGLRQAESDGAPFEAEEQVPEDLKADLCPRRS